MNPVVIAVGNLVRIHCTYLSEDAPWRSGVLLGKGSEWIEETAKKVRSITEQEGDEDTTDDLSDKWGNTSLGASAYVSK
jgi:hypothetical protein